MQNSRLFDSGMLVGEKAEAVRVNMISWVHLIKNDRCIVNVVQRFTAEKVAQRSATLNYERDWQQKLRRKGVQSTWETGKDLSFSLPIGTQNFLEYVGYVTRSILSLEDYFSFIFCLNWNDLDLPLIIGQNIQFCNGSNSLVVFYYYSADDIP